MEPRGLILMAGAAGSGKTTTLAAIINYIKRKHNLLIGERTAEQVKMTIGTAYVDADRPASSMEVKGRDLVAGIPKTVTVHSDEICGSLQEPIKAIVQAVRIALEVTALNHRFDRVAYGQGQFGAFNSIVNHVLRFCFLVSHP